MPGRRGRGRTRGTPNLTKGELELLFQRLIKQANLTPPETNVPFGPFYLDAVWWEAGIALEIDDYATHGTRTAFDNDRRRDRYVTAHRLRPVRVTQHDLTDVRARLVAELLAFGVPRIG